MSNIGKKIERLIADGFSYNTIRGLSEAQVNLLYNRLVEKVTPEDITQQQKLNAELEKTATLMRQINTPLKEDSDDDLIGQDLTKKMTGQLPPEDQSDESNDGMDDDTNPKNNQENEIGMTESEIREKFESKSQQRLFWAKCNNTKSEKAKKKWCKWAKEYSDDTNFKKLPEKKKDSKLEESLTKLIEKYIPESISKKELMSLIESSTRTKEAPTKTPTKTPTKKPGNPFRIKPHQKPSPKAELGEEKKNVEGVDVFYNKPKKNTNLPFKDKSEVKEGGAGAPAKAPVKTPTKTPSKSPGKKNPFKIEPAQKPGPKAKGPKWLSYNSFIKAGFNLK
jgi:hypothetical protein